jgi:transposase-like protein
MAQPAGICGGENVNPISFKRHRFPPDVIRYGVCLYFRFTLSIRDVEELLAQRGIKVSREAVRCWVIKFGPAIAANLRRRRTAPDGPLASGRGREDPWTAHVSVARRRR